METQTKTMYEEVMEIVNGDIYSIPHYSFFDNKNSEFYEILFSELFEKDYKHISNDFFDRDYCGRFLLEMFRMDETKQSVIKKFIVEKMNEYSLYHNDYVVSVINSEDKYFINEISTLPYEYLESLLKRKYKPSIDLLRGYYQLNKDSLDIEKFSLLCKYTEKYIISFNRFSDNTKNDLNKSVSEFLSFEVSNEVIEKIFDTKLIIDDNFLKHYLKRLNKNSKIFSNKIFNMITKRIVTKKQRYIKYLSVYKKLILTKNYDVLKTFKFDEIYINENYSISSIEKNKTSKHSNIFDFILNEFDEYGIKILKQYGFNLQKEYFSIILSNDIQKLRNFDFSSIEINKNYELPKNNKYPYLIDYIYYELDVEFLRVLIKNGFIIGNNFFNNYLKEKNHTDNSKVKLYIGLLDEYNIDTTQKENKFLDVFKLISQNSSENLLSIINKTSNKPLISDMINLLIDTNNVLLLFYLLDNGYNLSKENVKFIKNHKDYKFFLNYIENKYTTQYENILPYIF